MLVAYLFIGLLNNCAAGLSNPGPMGIEQKS